MIDHGTAKGYGQHRLIGERPCPDCTTAATAAARDRRRRDPNVKAKGRRTFAQRKTLDEFRVLAPELFQRIYREALEEWDRNNQIESTP